MTGGEVFERAADLWPQLVARAGLTASGSNRRAAYDQDLVDELRELLFPGATAPLEAMLASSDLTAEALVRAFFATLKPFAEMKADILLMLADAGARGSGDSLRVTFNFDPDSDPLDLLLEEFRSQMERLTETLVEPPAQVTYGDLWAIPRAGSEAEFRELHEEGATAGLRYWLGSYRRGSFERLPDDWPTGREDVDRRLGRVVDLVNGLLEIFKRYGRDRARLREAGYALKDQVDPSGFSVYELWVIESDFWPEAVVHWLSHRRADVRSGDEGSLVAMMNEIDRILPDSGALKRSLQTVLDDILDLPVWKQRHEVYAAWLGAQIYRGLASAGWNFRFHVVEGRLEFAFRGVHLATLRHPDVEDQLYWWTELRSLHGDLPSGHRTEGIQPDYRLRRPPISDPRSDVLVVEAKQHLRSSTHEFAAVLADYAHACPNAAVFLANHGPVSPKVLERVGSDRAHRCAAISKLHPGHPATVEYFRRALAVSLGTSLGGAPRASSPGPIEVHLTWGARPSDLDLHVTPVEDSGAGVSYRREEAPGLRHEGDVTRGFGPEVVHIDGAGVYDVTVHRYSQDGDFPSSGAQVEVILRHKAGRMDQRSYIVPTDCTGNWWKVVRIDAAQWILKSLDAETAASTH